MSPDLDTVPTAFINATCETADQLVFVLDDYHLFEDDSIHQVMTYLLDHQPENLHFVLTDCGELTPQHY